MEDRIAPTPAMNVVLYEDQTMDPITVIHLPSWMTQRLVSGERLRVPMIRRIRFEDTSGPIGPVPKTSVTIWFERFVRQGKPHWFAFTAEGDDALLCRATFLPGQTREVQDRERAAFMKGLLGIFSDQ